jgi:hypothetical protein
MKTCLGLLFTLVLFAVVLGSGGLIWYLSDTAEFSRSAGNPPVAIPVHPPAASQVRPQPGHGNPPVAIPVHPKEHR